MKDYIEYRINRLEIQRRKKYGDWEDFDTWQGKGIIASPSLMGLLRELRKYFKALFSK
jgi:hypothetical protein